jgi:hypothetical protein
MNGCLDLEGCTVSFQKALIAFGTEPGDTCFKSGTEDCHR